MTKNALIIVCLLITNIIFSQNKTREEIITLIADDTCECISADPETFSAKTDFKRKEIALGLCMLKSFNIRKKESKIFKKEKVDLEDLGEEVGLQMVSICGEEFMSIFSDEDLTELVEDETLPPPPPGPKNEDDLNIEVKLVSLNNDAISNFIVEDNYGKKHTFLIVEQFEGDDLLKKSNIDKDLKVYYKELDYYDLSEKRYVKKKVVKYIEEVN